MQPHRFRGRGSRPAVIIWLAVALAVILSAYMLLALRQSRLALERSSRRSAEALAESLALSVKNATRAGAIIDQLWMSRLDATINRLGDDDSQGQIPQTWLYELDASRIDWADMNGTIRRSSDPAAGSLPVALLLDSSWSAIRDGAVYAEFDRLGDATATVVRLDDRALVLWGVADRRALVERAIGAGYLVRSISELPGLEYVVLQSRDGIEMASRRVEQMVRIEEDSLLRSVLETSHVGSREYEFNDLPVIEAIARVPDEEQILRVGISRRPLEQLDRSITVQFSLLGGVLFLLGLGGLAVLWTGQRVTSMAADLSSAEALREELFAGIRAALLVVDGEGLIRLANASAAKLLGQPTDALVGQAYSAAAPGDPGRLTPLRDRGEASLEQEVAWRDRTGRDLVLLVSASRLRGDRGDACVIMHDVTEVRRLTRQAEQNERLAAMGDLAAGVAHEVRNPLNAISIAAQRLKAEFAPRSQEAEYAQLLGHLRSEIERVNRTVQEFLSLARGMKVAREPLDLKALVESIASGLTIEASQKGVTLTCEATTVEGFAGDPEALRKAILNLGQNALHATPEGGSVLLALRPVPGGARVEVIDTGSGIEGADLPHIFRPYFSRKRGGSGLGLALVHRIVTEHGGRIDVNSRPGEGTRFEVYLPVQATAPEVEGDA